MRARRKARCICDGRRTALIPLTGTAKDPILNANQTNAPALTKDYFNPDYTITANERKRRNREALLKDKISQMGHDPKKYEAWHSELQQIQLKVLPEPRHVIGQKIAAIDFERCTDKQLAYISIKLKKETSRRKNKILEQERLELAIKSRELKLNGWLEKSEAFSEIRRIVLDYQIFDQVTKNSLSNQKLMRMVNGTKGWNEVGPMKDGYIHCNVERTNFLFDPKRLLCHIIDQLKTRYEFHESNLMQQKDRAERIKAQKNLSAQQTAQAWYQKMQEQNAQFEKALADAKARKKMSIAENAFEEMS